jgi:DMSO reductase family type II enzyme chaperone
VPAARSAAYALFSLLLTSPWDEEDGRATLPPSDLESTLEALAAAFDGAVDERSLIAAAARLCPPGSSGESAAEALAKAYGGLFEVGSGSPPVPLREGHAEGRPESTREELVRYYDFFGYALRPGLEWRPDHLSVELEFVHFLAFRQARAEDAASGLALGQRDFVERHLLSWVPAALERLEARLAGADPGAAELWYLEVVRALAGFLVRDAERLRSAIEGGD